MLPALVVVSHYLSAVISSLASLFLVAVSVSATTCRFAVRVSWQGFITGQVSDTNGDNTSNKPANTNALLGLTILFIETYRQWWRAV